MSDNWKVSRTATSLESKYVFENYSTLRDFLDDVAELTEEMAIHPNISFGRDYASFVIHAVGEGLSDKEQQLATKIDEIFQRYS